MTVRHLKVFLAVYQTENVTRAAEELHITQPTVTRAIQELEQYYGVQLFERMNRRLFVSEAGHRLYAQAVHIVDSFDLMEKEMRDWDELGVLRIGATPTLGSVVLPKVLLEMHRRYPELKIKTGVFNGAYLQKALLDNQLDCALIEGNAEEKHLCREEFSQDRLVLILPPNDPRSKAKHLFLSDLANDRFLLREEGSMVRALLEHIFAVHGIVLEPAMESISTHAVIQAVHAGLGISFLPERLVWYSIQSGFVSTHTIDDESFCRKNYIIWHENKYLTRSAKELIHLCRICAGESVQ